MADAHEVVDHTRVGDFVHYVKGGGLAGNGQAHKCWPALIMATKPNEKLDLIVFSGTAATAYQSDVSQGRRSQSDSWHVKHKENE